jgi:hypothetical protein
MDDLVAWLSAARRRGPLLLLLLVANIIVATIAWFIVGMLLDWIL